MTQMLKFSRGNSYLGKGVWCFNLPSGHTCPGARECLVTVDRHSGKMTKGRHCKFRCYSAVSERFPAVRNQVWHNYAALLGLKQIEMMDLIWDSLPAKATQIRIHTGGDFWSQEYFDAWVSIAMVKPDIRFWAFTKSLPFWIARLAHIPDNLVMTASKGGKHDHLIEPYNLRYAEVFPTRREAKRSGLEIDDADVLARKRGDSFALVDNYAKEPV